MNSVKADLHLHLDGSMSLEVLDTLIRRTGFDLKGRSLKESVSVGAACKSLNDYLTCFDIPSALLQTAAALELTAWDLVKRLNHQGLIYAEIRFAPQLHCKGGMSQEQAVEAVLAGVTQACEEYPIKIGVLLCAMVCGSDKENQETLKLAEAYLGKGVAGADLAGAEGAVPMEHFRTMFEDIARQDVPFTIHAGECGSYQNIAIAVSFGARRIGHGCSAILSPDCMNLLKQEKIPLEMCVTSNVQTKAVLSLSEHPLKRFLDYGILVTYNTDNMTVSDTTLQNEAQLLTNYLGFAEEDLEQLNRNAIQAAFIGKQDRSELLSLL